MKLPLKLPPLLWAIDLPAQSDELRYVAAAKRLEHYLFHRQNF